MQALDELVAVITGSLKSIGFFTIVGPEQMGVFFKDILGRAGLSVNEGEEDGGVISQDRRAGGKESGLDGKGGLTRAAIPP